MKQLSLSLVLVVALGAMATSGCRSELPPVRAQAGTGAPVGGAGQAMPPTGGVPGGGEFRPSASAGVRFQPSTDANKLKELIAARSFSTRSDPFALLAVERAFDEAQLTERLSQEAGWSVTFEPKEEVVTVEPDEPQPYRRLAGILQSDSVSAILIMEDGRTEIIWPGRRIPNSEWRVVSIDGDRAILRRAGTKRPRVIEVRLETDPTPGGGGGAPAGGGAGGDDGEQGGARGRGNNDPRGGTGAGAGVG